MQTNSPSVLDSIPGMDETAPGLEVQPENTPDDVTPDAASSSGAGEQGEDMLDAVTAAFNSAHPVTDETPAVPAETEPDPGAASPSEASPEAAETTPTDETASTETPPADAAPEATPEEPGELPDDPTDEEMNSYVPRTRQRIETLLDQRKELRGQVEALQQENQVASHLKEFITENQISPDDWGLMMQVAADLRRGDFQQFLDKIGPYVNMAQQYVGQALPSDLHEQVMGGFITEDYARELSRLRLQEQMQTQQLQTAHHQQQESQMHTAAVAIRDVVNNWEADMRARDPDYAKKHGTVQRYAQAAIQANGAPRTPQEALAMVQQAYADAEKDLKAFVPAPAATTPRPGSAGSSTGARPEPKDLLEVAQQAFEDVQRQA